MPSNERLVKTVAAFKRDAAKAFDKAVKALLDLVWERGAQSVDFLFAADPQLDAEANAILRDMSDTLAAKAKKRAEEIIRELTEGYDPEAAWDNAEENESTPLLWRLDMEGSHLKELLEIWIALAVVNHIGKSELRVLVSRYLNNPYASPFWKDIRRDALRWGRGYNRNIIEQLVLIGQGAIVGAARYAQWADALGNGADYYIRRRGSNYDCKTCEDMANKPIPISVPFQIPHPRCMCWPEFFLSSQ